ncbi:hypothetical protein LU293_07400 [Moraxella nasovis]|nr:hypothetical protein [Moraxella nasovis]UNU72913.1 hypothetical protein LU293_07400 [Moraxella nasovis]
MPFALVILPPYHRFLAVLAWADFCPFLSQRAECFFGGWLVVFFSSVI